MEWCETILEEWKCGKYLRRWSGVLSVLTLFAFLTSVAADMPVAPEKNEKNGETVQEIREYESDTEAEILGMGDTAEEDSSEILEDAVVPVTEDSTNIDISASVLQPGEEAADISLNIPQSEEMVSDIPVEVPQADDVTLPDIPELEDVQEVPGAEDTDNSMEEESAEPEEEGGVSEGFTVIEGFYVDESGMICGIADGNVAVSDGYMELPSQGCSGIVTGAFEDALTGIQEVYIPSNITVIEEGAFLGLNEAGWFEAAPGGTCFSRDGVLFSEEGACLLAFPAGRIGIYQVPPDIIRFAKDAFAGSSLEKLDMRKCSVEDLGNLPEGLIWK